MEAEKMSTISEKARAEGDQAEAETPDEPQTPAAPDEAEEEEDAAQEPPAAPPEALTDTEIEKRYKKAGTVAQRYVTQLTAALGSLIENFVPSPLDDLPGFVQVDQQGQPAPDVKAQTLAFLGQEPPADFAQNPDTSTCRRCKGYGDLLSGSKRKGNELLKCGECNGYGYLPPPNVVGQLGPALLPAAPNGAPSQPAALPHGPEDPRVAELRAAGYMVLPPAPVAP